MHRVLAGIVLAAALAPGQNFDHPGLVHCEGFGWLKSDEAKAKGCIEYRGRWYPAALKAKLAAWEKEDAKHATWKNARKLESKHYRITSDLPRFILETEIIPFLDQLYVTYVDVFARDFGVSGKAANKKLILVFNGFEGYARYGMERGDRPNRMNPAYIAGGSELVTYYEETDPALFYAGAFHEAAHQFVAAVLPGARFPTWIDEGLATYFEGCTYSRATRKVTPGFLPSDRLAHAQGRLRKVEEREGASLVMELFATLPQERFNAEHYALSWSFIHYLVYRDDGKFKPAFMRFLREMNGSGAKPVPEVFKIATGKELTAVEKGWKDYVLGLKSPKAPWWTWVGVSGKDAERSGLKNQDRVSSIDGVDVFDASHFEELWRRRPKDRPIEIVVSRKTPAPAPIDYVESLVTATIAPDLEVELQVASTQWRHAALRD